jgi:hypothetical protein
MSNAGVQPGLSVPGERSCHKIGIILFLVDLEDCRCAAYFVRYHKKWFAVWAVLCLDEEKSFRGDVIGSSIHVLNKTRAERIRHVVDHYARGTLESDEGIGAAESFSKDHAFWFGTFVVTPRVESRGCAVGIERLWNLRGGYPLEVITAVENEISTGRSD